MKNIVNTWFLQGGGQAGQRIREIDWLSTELGEPSHWPLQLQVSVSIILNSSEPMFVYWGKDLLTLCNDAAVTILEAAGMHQVKLGEPAKQFWADAWYIFEPVVSVVVKNGNGIKVDDTLVTLEHNDLSADVWWNYTCNPLLDQNAATLGILMLLNNTTTAMIARQKLEAKEMHFQNFIQEAVIGIVILLGEDMIVDTVNKAYCEMIARSPAELIGKPLFSIIPETEAFFRPILRNVLYTGEPFYLYETPYSINVQGRQKQGYLDVVYQPYRDRNTATTGVIALCHDVTAQLVAKRKLEESEQQVRSLIESAPFPIGVYRGRELKIELANQTMLDTWGKGNVIGQFYPEVLPELAETPILQQLDDVLTSGIAFHAKTTRVDLVIEGKLLPHYFNYSFTPVKDAEGNVYAVMNTASDVTDLVLAKNKIQENELLLQARVEERTADLQSLNDRLLAMNKQLEQFTFAASHDMQEPLRKVQTFASMLIDNHSGRLDEKGLLFLDKIDHSVQRLRKIINDLLKYSHESREGQMREPVPLDIIFGQIESDLELMISQKEATIVRTQLPVLVGVSSQINQLFYNLFSNALKFSKPNVPVEITVTADPLSAEHQSNIAGLDSDSSYTIIRFSDNGIGFDPQYSEQIFNLFKRLHGKDEYAGTGIGLGLCRKITEQHHGSITASSTPGNGATFTVILPTSNVID